MKRLLKKFTTLRASEPIGARGRNPALPPEADLGVSAKRVYLGSTLEFLQRDYSLDRQDDEAVHPEQDQEAGGCWSGAPFLSATLSRRQTRRSSLGRPRRESPSAAGFSDSGNVSTPSSQ